MFATKRTVERFIINTLITPSVEEQTSSAVKISYVWWPLWKGTRGKKSQVRGVVFNIPWLKCLPAVPVNVSPVFSWLRAQIRNSRRAWEYDYNTGKDSRLHGTAQVILGMQDPAVF